MAEVKNKTRVPQIEEIRALIGPDGEAYINLDDLSAMMRQLGGKTKYLTMSTQVFIKEVIFNLGGDHE